MNYNKKKGLFLVLNASTFFIVCSENNNNNFNFEHKPPLNLFNKQSNTQTMNYDNSDTSLDIPLEERSTLAINYESTSSKETPLNSNPLRTFRCQWPYKWEYSKDDDVKPVPDKILSGKICSVSDIRLKCCSCCCPAALSFLICAISYVNNNTNDYHRGCINITQPKTDFIICTTLGIASGFLTFASLCAPCCNQKAWDEGKYCNRYVKKNSN